jgi:hypothetical protein
VIVWTMAFLGLLVHLGGREAPTLRSHGG